MTPDPIPAELDLLVAGSGAAGLCGALTAHAQGLRVAVVEKTALVGGTSALSEGMAWIPCSAQARAAGVRDDPAQAVEYIRATAGRHFDEARARAYVAHAAGMLGFLERHSAARFELVAASMDYYPDAPGHLAGGRALRPCLFDGRRLGADFARLRPPLPTTMLWGGLPIASADLPHYFSLLRSWRARAHVARVVGRYAVDRLAGWPRGTRLGNGNALVAALWWSLREARVPVVTGVRLLALQREGGRVTGATVHGAAGERFVAARRGVLLAGGGFPADAALTRQLYPHLREGKNHVRIAPASNTGDTVRAALEAGARLDDGLASPAAWSPASVVPQSGGEAAPFPHYIDRGKPGIVCVDPAGRRFTNEAQPYQDFVRAMLAAAAGRERVEAFLVADHRALRRYGLGVVPPAPGRLGPHLASGYLVRGRTLAELAGRLGLPPGQLEATIARFNADARAGTDTEFQRGASAYHRAAGDPAHRPNPTLGAVEVAPFYAVRLQPGDIGTLAGLAADGHGRVLDGEGVPIAGLYAAGNDAASPLGGEYPAAGVTIGAALTFGFIAARHAAQGGAS
jgi:succinate dehydrogenase/fumarate reductase flavoprotein subunit